MQFRNGKIIGDITDLYFGSIKIAEDVEISSNLFLSQVKNDLLEKCHTNELKISFLCIITKLIFDNNYTNNDQSLFFITHPIFGVSSIYVIIQLMEMILPYLSPESPSHRRLFNTLETKYKEFDGMMNEEFFNKCHTPEGKVCTRYLMDNLPHLLTNLYNMRRNNPTWNDPCSL